MNFPITRYFQILIGILSGPGIIFILPFIIPSSQYAKFIGFTVVVQLISIFGSAGIEIIGARNLIAPSRIVRVLIFTHVLAFLGAYVFVDEYLGISLLALLCAFSGNLSTTMLNYILFLGQTKKYAFINLFRAGILVLGISWAILLNENLIVSWVVLNFVVSIFSLWAVNRAVRSCKKVYTDSSARALIGSGLTMFLINIGATLPFIFDRIMAKNHLSSEIFAQFMVATTWSLPIVYLGNATQQLIVASGDKLGLREIYAGMLQLISKSLVYVFVVLFASIIYTPPYFSNSSKFIFMWLSIFSWQATYSCLMFPIAALIQRGMPLTALKPIRNLTMAVVAFALITYFVVVSKRVGTVAFMEIVLYSSIFAFAIVLCRVYPIRRWLLNSQNS